MSESVIVKSYDTDVDIASIKRFIEEFYYSIKSGTLEADDYYVSDYGLHNGMTREQMISSDLERIGTGVNIVLEGNKRIDIDMVGLLDIVEVDILDRYIKDERTIFNIEIVFRQVDGEAHRLNRSITKEGDKWKFIGNSKLFNMTIDPEVRRWITPYSITVATGLGFYIDQFYDSDLWTFIIRGDGLPEEGIKMVRKNITGEEITIVLDDNYMNSPGLLAGRWNFYALTDDEIQKISDSSIYTVYAYDSKDFLLDVQTVKVRKRPLRMSEISENDFSSLKFSNTKYKELLMGDNRKINVTLYPPRSHIFSFISLTSFLISRNSTSKTHMLLSPSSQQMEIEILRDTPKLADIAIFDVSTYKEGIFYVNSYVFTDWMINGDKGNRVN